MQKHNRTINICNFVFLFVCLLLLGCQYLFASVQNWCPCPNKDRDQIFFSRRVGETLMKIWMSPPLLLIQELTWGTVLLWWFNTIPVLCATSMFDWWADWYNSIFYLMLYLSLFVTRSSFNLYWYYSNHGNRQIYLVWLAAAEF